MKVSSSFRDPSGFVFYKDKVVYRQINHVYKDHYDHLMQSGLYELLVKKGLLIAHEEVSEDFPEPEHAYLCIKPIKVPFVSYPYEWSFSQLKRAALVTLRIQALALEHGMFLKDASAYNIQFFGARPVFIDTLSFEKYEAEKPWVAYKQFCEHFLAPLFLMAYKDISLHKLFRVFLDGVPLSLASSLLPFMTRLKFSSLFHVHLHARSQRAHEGDQDAKYTQYMSKKKMIVLIDSLERAVRKISWKPEGTEWGDYYNDTNYSEDSFEIKKALIRDSIEEYKPKTVWDIGANTGVFSRIASEAGIETVSFDIDEAAVEKNYRQVVEKKEQCILPLIMDVSNPSPGLGWVLKERDSLVQRGPADMVIAVALIHHLTIGGNAPFDMVAQFFHSIARTLVIEFVPKEDSQVQRLLSSREDVFTYYDISHFKIAFGKYFRIENEVSIEGSERTLFTMTKNEL